MAASGATAERRARGPGASEAVPDLASRTLREDPYPHYARLRDAGPVLRARLDGEPAWVVPRYEDCLSLLTHPDFRPGADPVDPLLFHDADGAYVVEGRIAAALKPRAIEALRLRVAEAVIGTLDQAERRGRFDLVHDFASSVASVGTCELLGVAPGEAVLVGDSRFDREAAAAAGVRFVGLGTTGDVQIRRLSGLLDALDRSPMS